MWSKSNPGLLIILCNQKEWSIKVCNRIVKLVITACASNIIRDRCYIYVIGHAKEVRVLCSGWTSDLFNNPLRIDKRLQKVSDGNGGFVEVSVTLLSWVEQVIGEQSLNAKEGLALAEHLIDSWKKDYPYGPTPVILDINCSLVKEGVESTSSKYWTYGIGSTMEEVDSIYDDVPDYFYQRYGDRRKLKGVFSDNMIDGLIDYLIYDNKQYLD